MKKFVLAVLCIFCLSALCVAADKDDVVLKARLRGLGEVPPVASAATGSFAGLISADGMSITYTLTYANLNAHTSTLLFPKKMAEWWYSCAVLLPALPVVLQPASPAPQRAQILLPGP